MNWEYITYNTSEFHRRVKDLAADLSRDLRGRRKPKPMRRNATLKQRAIHNRALAEYYAGQQQRKLFRAARNRANAAKAAAKRQAAAWKTFTPVSFPYDDWYDLPEDVKQWSHLSGSFLYNNNMWDVVPIPYESFVDGYDHDWYDGTSQIVERRFAGVILFDPQKIQDSSSDVRFFVYASEWNSAVTLDPDYIRNRRYRTS